MTDIDVSSLTRLTATALDTDLALQLAVRNVLDAANGDGQPNAEDSVLSQAEIQAFLSRNRSERQGLLPLFRQHLGDLAGSLSSAQNRVRDLPHGRELAGYLEMAAGLDSTGDRLSDDELDALESHLQDDSTTTGSFTEEVRSLVEEIDGLEEIAPEAFVPENPAEQRADIDLNFLKAIDLEANDEGTRRLRNLLRIAGVSPDQRDINWSIGYEEVEAHLTRVQEARRRAEAQGLDVSGIVIDDPVRALADLRFMAMSLRGQIAEPTENQVVDPDLERSRQVLADLENMRAGITHRDRQYAEGNAVVGLIDNVTYVATVGGGLTALANGVFNYFGAGYDFDDFRLTPEESAEYGADWARFGATYRHYVRASVMHHDRERSAALSALRDILEYPPSDFTSPEGQPLARTIPNALEYLRTHDDSISIATGRGMGMDAGVIAESVAPGSGNHRRYYELLTGEYFQARRLWDIRSETDPARQTRSWYDFAQHLRSGEIGPSLSEWFGGSGASHSTGLRNLDFSRAILHALRAQSREPAMRREAEAAYRDSMGWALLDERGQELTSANGELGLNPSNWFGNYSDESADAVASDVVALAASIYVGFRIPSAATNRLIPAQQSILNTLRQFGLQVASSTAAGGALPPTLIGATRAVAIRAAQAICLLGYGSFVSGVTGMTFDRLRTRRNEQMDNFDRSFDLLLRYPPRALSATPQED